MIDPSDIELDSFLRTWYGPPTREAARLPRSYDWLPEPLREWHGLTSQWDVNLVHSTAMVAPQEIHIAGDGKAIFMVDPTGDWRWAFDSSDPEKVFDGSSRDPWIQSSEGVREFLMQNTVREVINRPRVKSLWAFTVPDEALVQVTSSMGEVQFSPCRWPEPGFRFFMGHGALAEVVDCIHGPGWQVRFVAASPEVFAGIENMEGVDWRSSE
ncbi:hypothetical protein OG594_24615 [Streptomyces sp. NBC_01214]|uniref:hypothetical protein n=1 Tax=Streptomyces sp. NBC_01214 TaxID=2903777 RepID=UPI0022551D10|nr:hypothetical protein [Streptomyces sp. NBC_01214]MCX4804755.1 hypothetical protein [Streptomyces sp. NBC_01214]